VAHQTLRRAGRWFSPTALVLVGLCFLLPFATVSCDAPGGYGRAAPGGTTTYTGVDLILGGEPAVSPPDKIVPSAQARPARLGPAPAAGVVLLLVLAGIGFATSRAQQPRTRRASVAVLAGTAATALLVNQALVESTLAVRLAERLAVALPAGKSLRDYVHTGIGFGLALSLLFVVTIVNAVGWWRVRSRPALVAGSGQIAPEEPLG
jgi:hypothetical protein